LDGVMATLHVWRHPKPREVAGRCIGHTNVAVDARKIKRLAHRIRRAARQQGLPHVVWTSPLQRCFLVGRCLARWGWLHRVDERLSEMNFGAWDGLSWGDISKEAVDAWCANFAAHAPGNGESVLQVLMRCRAMLAEFSNQRDAVCVVGHAGWISAMTWLAAQSDAPPSADQWPASVAYNSAHAYDVNADDLQTLISQTLNSQTR
jgi:alpha-ribazole phosphatase